MAKFRFFISTKLNGCSRDEIIEIDDKELEGKTQEEQDSYIWDEYYMHWVNENAELTFYEVSDEE